MIHGLNNSAPLEPFPLIEIGGNPFERGVQYGRKAAAFIHRCISHYNLQFEALNIDAEHLSTVISGYIPAITRFDPALVDEMRGIAHGASIAFEDVVLINARTEIAKLATSPDRLALLAESFSDEGCTGVVVLPAANENGATIHGQNWDWKTVCVEGAVVLRIDGAGDTPDILTFTEAGALARCGLNSAGIGLTANFLGCNRDFLKVGVPSPIIRRKALEQKDFALALHIIATTPKTGSSNIMLSHSSGYAANLECAPDETFLSDPEDGILVHANHWINPVAQLKLVETGLASYPESIFRQQRVKELLRDRRGGISLEAIKAVMADSHLSPWSVCRPPSPNPCHGNMSTATVATVLMQPALGTLEVAPLPAIGGKFSAYAL